MQGDVELILRNQSMVEKSDYFTWMYNKSGQLTVKYAYWLASTVKAEKNLLEVFMLPSLSALK